MKRRIKALLLAVIIVLGVIMSVDMPIEAAGIDYSPVFNATWYAQHNPDLAAAGITTESKLLNHFVNSGMAEGRQACEEFNVQAYMNRYADLRAAFGNNLKAYYMHYINGGKAEGRNGRADGSVAAQPTVVTTQATTSGALHTTPAYPVWNTTSGWGSWLSVRAGQSNGFWTATQSNIDQANYNPYGLTSGTSVITGSARIGDIRYLDLPLHEAITGANAHSYKMECYAINRNGVPLFRRYGSKYNVYSNGTNLVAAIDSITPTTTVREVDNTIVNKLDYSINDTCTSRANACAVICGSLLIPNYNIVSDEGNHEVCLIHVSGNIFLIGRDAHNFDITNPGADGRLLINPYVSHNTTK